MDTPSGPEIREDCNDDTNTYVDLLPETHDKVTKTPIPFQITQSQKRRRKFIPLKYHSKIFKRSKKKTDKDKKELSTFKEVDVHKQGTRLAVDDNRASTNSSSYASCRPYRSNVSCHTYVDIEECLEHRDMEIERCNSISTVATLPIDLPSPRRNEEKDMIEKGKRQLKNTCIQEESPVDMTPRIHYEMKIPDKNKGMKKYLVLFCFVLISIVVSTVAAGYFGTKDIVKDIVKDIPNEVQALSEQLDTLPDQTQIETLLDQGLTNFTGNQQTLNKRLETVASQMESDFSLFINETKTDIESIPRRLMNETDYFSVNADVIRKLYNTILILVCVNNCTGREDGDYQSCYTCEGYVSCSGGILYNRNCSESQINRPVFWDHFSETCEYQSKTCHPLYTFG